MKPDKTNGVVDYYDGPHVYKVRKTGHVLESVTGVLKNYAPAFNTEAQSIKSAERYGATPKFWRDLWEAYKNQAAGHGSKRHSIYEENNLRKLLVRPPVDVTHLPVFSEVDATLPELPDGVYPEFLAHWLRWDLAGQADLVIKLGQDFWVSDLKTTKDISAKKAYGKRMNPPFQRMPGNSYGKFLAQINFYAAMIEKMFGLHFAGGHVHQEVAPGRFKLWKVPIMVDKVKKELDETRKAPY